MVSERHRPKILLSKSSICHRLTQCLWYTWCRWQVHNTSIWLELETVYQVITASSSVSSRYDCGRLLCKYQTLRLSPVSEFPADGIPELPQVPASVVQSFYLLRSTTRTLEIQFALPSVQTRPSSDLVNRRSHFRWSSKHRSWWV